MWARLRACDQGDKPLRAERRWHLAGRQIEEEVHDSIGVGSAQRLAGLTPRRLLDSGRRRASARPIGLKGLAPQCARVAGPVPPTAGSVTSATRGRAALVGRRWAGRRDVCLNGPHPHDGYRMIAQTEIRTRSATPTAAATRVFDLDPELLGAKMFTSCW